jgi:small subunit ribosomal protein S3
MGQKVNPIGLRVGINRTWDSRWFAGKAEYGSLLHEDIKIRKELMKQLKQAAVSHIVIERPHKKCRVTIHSARPGVVIGKKGADIEKLRKSVAKLTDSDVVINIVEIRKPELDAQLVAEFTTYGTCGVKVWIFKGEILEHDPMAQDKKQAEGDTGRPRRETAA